MNKSDQIYEIKRVISEWGSTSSCELELSCSPCINSMGNGKNNVSQLVERFMSDGVEAVTYHDEVELGEEFIPYEDLDENLVDEIYNIIMEYDVSQKKLFDSCKDENF